MRLGLVGLWLRADQVETWAIVEASGVPVALTGRGSLSGLVGEQDPQSFLDVP